MSSREAKAESTPPSEALAFQEIYPLNPPHAYAAIARDPTTGQLRYLVVEPSLTDDEKKLLERLKAILREELTVEFKSLEEEGAEKYLKKALLNAIKTYRIKVTRETAGKLMYYITRDFIHHGKIDPMMRDHLIEDISCDGVGVPIYVWHRKYESLPTNIRFDTAEELDSFIVRLAYKAGRHITIAQPILDAGLPDGSRVQLTFGREVTQKGSTFTIRKFRADPLTVVDLIQFNTLSPEMAAWLWYLVEHRHSALVAGGIASGKTTFLNCLSMFIRPELKIVSIEDTPELNIPHENWIQSVTRVGFGAAVEGRRVGEISLFDLLKAAVRQRPDYIIVGEIRGAEAYTLFQAMATGHMGMSTIHADSVVSTIHRLETEPMNIPRSLMTAIDTIVVLTRARLKDMPVRRAQTVTEIVGLDPISKELLTSDVYVWNPRNDTFEYQGRSYLVERTVSALGITVDDAWEDIERRKIVLEWMAREGIRRYKDVGAVIRQFYINPEHLYQRAKVGLALA